MATQTPLYIDGNNDIAKLPAGDKLGGITGGTSTGEAMTQDQFGANSTEMDPTGEPAFVGVTTGIGGVTVGGPGAPPGAVLLKASGADTGQINLAPNAGTRLLQLGGDFSLLGGFAAILRNTATTDVTLPTTGTLLASPDIGSTIQAYDADLAAIAGLSSAGIIARTGAGTAAARTITLGSSLSGSNLDGVSGNPTFDTIQDIRTTAAPQFAQVIAVADGGAGFTATRYSTNVGGPTVTMQKAGGTRASALDAVAGYVAFQLIAQAYDAGAFRTIGNLQGRCATGFGGGDSPGLWAFQTTPAGAYVQRDVVLFDDAGNIQLVLAGALNAAATDVVSMVGVDNGAGNREWQLQPESGGLLAYGADVLRRVPTANRNVDDRIKSVTTTDATVTTVDTIPITASSTYLIETRIVGRRTGGSLGTADDGWSYVRRGTYTTKAGTVTLMGAVQVTGTDAEDQILADATLTISGTNVLVRVTGTASNNISWQAHTLVERIAS